MLPPKKREQYDTPTIPFKPNPDCYSICRCYTQTLYVENAMNHLLNNTLSLTLGILLAVTAGCRRDPVGRAMRALERNNPALAESLLAGLAEASPDDPSIQANLALARMKLGQADAALAGFRRAADLAPADPRPLEFMAAMAASEGRWRMSLELLFEAERRDPRSPRLQTALANAELKIPSPLAARTRLTHVLGFAPNYSPALFNLAVLMQDHLNSPSEAAQFFERYLAISGDSEHKEYARKALAQLRNSQSRPSTIANTPNQPDPKTVAVATPVKPPPAPPSKPASRRPTSAGSPRI
jgi:tetratricopeptide (TPR) repeat protein